MVILQTVHKLSKQFSARWSFVKKIMTKIDFISRFEKLEKLVESCDSIREIVAISHDF